jgi:drug/metabolite transporter (DMT)-like permease
MTLFALILVLTAAFIHAGWNLLAKRARGGIAFLWLVDLVTSIIYAPLAAFIIYSDAPRLDGTVLFFILGSSAIHLGYFFLLLRGYQVGDLSLVYPLARGTGPVLSAAAAVIFLGERPTPLAIAGSILIAIGVFALTFGGDATRGSAGIAIAYGVVTGIFIAGYTLWDKYAVSVILVAPVLMDWGRSVALCVGLTPVAALRWNEVRMHWSKHRLEALGIGIGSSLSYILILTTMVFTPVSYIAPAREISILIGTVMGARLLAEGDTARRLAAASAMVLGVLALAIG